MGSRGSNLHLQPACPCYPRERDVPDNMRWSWQSNINHVYAVGLAQAPYEVRVNGLSNQLPVPEDRLTIYINLAILSHAHSPCLTCEMLSTINIIINLLRLAPQVAKVVSERFTNHAGPSVSVVSSRTSDTFSLDLCINPVLG